ncbi:bifunctional Gfo/Idh/MocA family oxidoreductase/class I SAM-dependent methyltransferase [Paenibacillus sp. 481]|uniref:bifunctional Gfo/Idh/MocA family oxidoreductase/class I SAM-dependent methyltransferase n=1 Tax=Paenibacillus sp. 481 TaxID=2835869 RepID=UPI001E517E7D|nr:bifunctional Gfo/Idh/MocA family oxidoreductase/class I SAM-dependent methyltransferase [Paenibacillus sp. 481]UHA73195.1 Gfo/Idh/MocA family oxidoreductase [Paenibacillus sp. 481]
MNNKKWRTVVCGSTFGQFYMEALKLLPEQFELVGLLGQGSERTKKCAKYYGIHVYTEVDQLPPDIDLACVVLRSGVLGGKGTDVSLKLLERGIHVIQEQPVHHKDMAACLRTARQHGVIFQTGDLYVHLPAVRQFIASAKVLLEQQDALYIDAAFASQVSYPMMHIFSQVLPSIRPWKINAVSREGGPFHVLTGTVANIPITLRVHNEVDPNDPDNYLHLLHQMTIGTEGGRLSLTDTHGPVVWNPRLHIPDNMNILGELTGASPMHVLENSTETIGTSSPMSYKDILTKQWPQAIAHDLLGMRELSLENANANMRAQQELLCSSQWHEMTAALGYPVLRPGCTHQPLPVNLLKEAASQIEDDSARFAHGNDVASFCYQASTDISACTDYGDRELHGLDAECVASFVKNLDEAVFHSMIYALQTEGLLTSTEREYSISEILAMSQTAPQHHDLIKRWLVLLSERGYIQRNGDRMNGVDVVTENKLKDCWKAVREIWDGKLGSPLTMDYLISNAEQLPQLMRGEQQAAFLLFPEGKMDYAHALYRETITARYLNQSVSEAVMRIGAAKQLLSAAKAEQPLTIIEIGAGTGSTTEVVVPRLKASANVLSTAYLFTDVSHFFLSAARERYKDCPWMQFQVVDIDKDVTEQGLQLAQADIIIAAGVLNNAFNTDKAVAGLVQLLVPGGWLLFTEPVREFPEILISQSFMMTQPEDDRKRSQSTFMSVKQWQDVFARAGAAEVLTLLDEAHPLAPLGQQFFAVRKKNDAEM